MNVLDFVAVLAELLDDQVDVYHAGLDAEVEKSDCLSLCEISIFWALLTLSRRDVQRM
jgi:hypothetical protein